MVRHDDAFVNKEWEMLTNSKLLLLHADFFAKKSAICRKVEKVLEIQKTGLLVRGELVVWYARDLLIHNLGQNPDLMTYQL